jgi:hypothetical protein
MCAIFDKVGKLANGDWIVTDHEYLKSVPEQTKMHRAYFANPLLKEIGSN